MYFNPRPREGGDVRGLEDAANRVDISIHAPREGGDDVYAQIMAKLNISIHAPREGGDVAVDMPAGGGGDISIHAPREGGDSLD